jgi:hypothetical protein
VEHEFVWRCHQDVAAVVVVEEVEVAEDRPPHVIPGMISLSHTVGNILKFCFVHQFDILLSTYKSFITCLI